jgi:hypothetical protein
MTDPTIKVRGCSAVNAHISQPIPSTLWHYTSYDAFMNICTSKEIWATDYRFLNDREEFNHAKKIAQKLVDEVPQFSGASFPAQDMLRQGLNVALNTGSLREDRLRIMVASFSENGDQLSQWRGYAGNSTGVSIGLDLRGLRPPLEIGTTVAFAPCVYSDSDKRVLLKAIFEEYIKGLQTWWDSIVGAAMQQQLEVAPNRLELIQKLISDHGQELNQVLYRCQEDLTFDLLRLAPFLKDESFSEEKEWRLALPSEIVRMPIKHPIKYRAGRNTLIPFVAYPLLLKNQEGDILCNDLILGPGSHSSAEVGVNMFFQSRMMMIIARPSKIPYRPT